MAAARVRTNRFVLHWGWVQPVQGSYRWGPADRVHRPACLPRNQDGPGRVGEPGLAPGLRLDAPDRRARAPRTRGGTSSRRWWRATDLAAATGPPRTNSEFPGAAPLPIQSWQIWNEPNLQKYFAPTPSPGKYARLVQISHDAITTKDPNARIVLAGLSGNGDVAAQTFLNSFYAVSGIKNKFDAAALHPYAPTLESQRLAIQRVRNVMTSRGDAATPLWLTELAWGSAPPDELRPQQGPLGQAKHAHQRLQDDPAEPHRLERRSASSGTAGGTLILPTSMRRAASAPARGCSVSTAPVPQSRPTPRSGASRPRPPGPRRPSPGGQVSPTTRRRPSPSPRTSAARPSSAGSTEALTSHAARRIRPRPQANGNHAIFVKAIDAPGNESAFVWRGFNVDTQPPPAPTITDTDPNSPANDNAPEVKGTAAAGTTVRLYKTAGCTGTPVGVRSAANFASPGITASVPDNSTTAFRARAVDAAGNLSACSARPLLRRGLDAVARSPADVCDLCDAGL